MDVAEIILVLVNLCLGLAFAILLSKRLSVLIPGPRRIFRYFILFLGIYFIECVAIVAAMLLPIFSVGLAFVWGIFFGLWLRKHASARKVLKTSFFISLYTIFPAASFILVPLFGLVSGWDILNAAEAARFGIPDFLYWPFNTILGFYLILCTGIFILKTTITPGIVSLIIHLKKNQENNS